MTFIVKRLLSYQSSNVLEGVERSVEMYLYCVHKPELRLSIVASPIEEDAYARHYHRQE